MQSEYKCIKEWWNDRIDTYFNSLQKFEFENNIKEKKLDKNDFKNQNIKPMLKALGLEKIFQIFFNSKLNADTVLWLDSFFDKIVQNFSGKNKNDFACEIRQQKTDKKEDKVLELFSCIVYALKFQENIYINDIDDVVFFDRLFYFKRKYEENRIIDKIDDLQKKMMKIKNFDYCYLIEHLRDGLDALINNLEKITDRYVEIDKNSESGDDLGLVSLNIDDFEVKYLLEKICPQIIDFLLNKEKIYDTNTFKGLKKELRKVKNRKTFNHVYYKDLKSINQRLDELIIDKFDSFFYKEYKGENSEKFCEILKELYYSNEIIRRIFISASKSDFRDLNMYDDEKCLKRYKKATEGLDDVCVRFENKSCACEM